MADDWGGFEEVQGSSATDEWAGFEDWSGFEDLDAEQPAAAPEQEMGVAENLVRGIAERGAQVMGGLADTAADLGRNLEERIPLGGFVRDENATLGFSYASPEEYKQQEIGRAHV